jgi:hypothetical protein
MTYENPVEAAEFIESKYPHAIGTAIVLGRALGAFAGSEGVEDSVQARDLI